MTVVESMETDKMREIRRRFIAPLFAKWKGEGRRLDYLAARIHVPPSRLSEWHTGSRGIPEHHLRALCIEIGIARDLLGSRPYRFVERPRHRSA